MGIPVLVQHVSTSENQLGSGYWSGAIAGTPYHIRLPNVALSGNCLILGVSYPNSAGSITVSDDHTNTWTLAKSISNGSITSAVYVSLNVASGTSLITATFGTASYNCQFCLSEFYNISSASALDGNNGNTASSVPNISAGSLTTTIDGDLIYNYGYNTTLSGTPKVSALTGATAGSGFTLLSADIMLGTFAQYAVQATHGAINPSITLAGGTNAFNSVGIALKNATQGTAPSNACRVVHRNEILYTRAGVPVLFPSVGSLLVVATSRKSSNINVVGMSDNHSNSWVESPQGTIGGDLPSQTWFAANATTALNQTITPNCQGGTGGAGAGDNGTTFFLYDVIGAGDFDATAGYQTNWISTSSATQSCPAFLSITPTVANGFIFLLISCSFGPPGSLDTPSGSVLDTSLYGGQVDADLMDNADAYCHYYNPNTSAAVFGFTLNGSASTSFNKGITFAFKPAAAPSIVRPQPSAASVSSAIQAPKDVRREQAAPGAVSSAASTARRMVRPLVAVQLI